MKRLDRLYLRFHRMTIRGLGCRVGRFRGSLESQRCQCPSTSVHTCNSEDIERGNADHEEEDKQDEITVIPVPN
jgi:hypothetical protein